MTLAVDLTIDLEEGSKVRDLVGISYELVDLERGEYVIEHLRRTPGMVEA